MSDTAEELVTVWENVEADFPEQVELIGETIKCLEQLQARNAELERELKESGDDLEATQKSLGELETKYESIESVFCDEDGCPAFEPFTAENLCDYMNREKAEVAKNAIREARKYLQFNYTYTHDCYPMLDDFSKQYAQRNYGVKGGE